MRNTGWLFITMFVLLLGILTTSGCGVAQSDYDALLAQKNALENEKIELQTELNEINQKYPPREFTSRTELEEWLYKNDVSDKPEATYADSWYAKALEIQDDALQDGYIISADYDYYEETDTYYVFCTTVIEGYVWWWDPETDEVISDTYLGKVR